MITGIHKLRAEISPWDSAPKVDLMAALGPKDVSVSVDPKDGDPQPPLAYPSPASPKGLALGQARARQGGMVSGKPDHIVHVSGIMAELADEEKLADLFSHYGRVLEVDLRDDYGPCSWALVTFGSAVTTIDTAAAD